MCCRLRPVMYKAAANDRLRKTANEWVSSLNFSLWANILSNFNKCRVLCSAFSVCIFISFPQNFQEHSPSQLATHTFFYHRPSFFSVLSNCNFSIHAVPNWVCLCNWKTRRKKKTPTFSLEKNLFQLNSKWAESHHMLKMQSSRSNVCKYCRRLFCKRDCDSTSGLGYATEEKHTHTHEKKIEPNFMF